SCPIPLKTCCRDKYLGSNTITESLDKICLLVGWHLEIRIRHSAFSNPDVRQFVCESKNLGNFCVFRVDEYCRSEDIRNREPAKLINSQWSMRVSCDGPAPHHQYSRRLT